MDSIAFKPKPESQDDDEKLVLEVQSGSDGAFKVLFERYRPFLEGIAFNKIRDSHTAEDLAQEAFTKAFLAIKEGKYRGENKFKSWLASILMNLVIDLVRKKNISKTDLMSNIIDEAFWFVSNLEDENPNPEQMLLNADFQARIEGYIDRLSPDRKWIIQKRLQSIPFEELAHEKGKASHELRSLFYRAKQDLEAMMLEDPEFMQAYVPNVNKNT